MTAFLAASALPACRCPGCGQPVTAHGRACTVCGGWPWVHVRCDAAWACRVRRCGQGHVMRLEARAMNKPPGEWRRSSFCQSGECITVTASRLHADLIYIGRELDGERCRGQLTVTRAEFAAFLAGAKDGQFDDLAVTP